MDAVLSTLTAFSARATRGRRLVLLVYSAIITLLVAGLSALIAASAREHGGTVSTLALADMIAMMIVAAALFVIAPAMVAAQVAEERRSGTLDLLRTAPVSPRALAFGFLAGAPGSIYLLCVGPLGLHVLAGVLGAYPPALLPLSLLVVLVGSACVQLGAMLLAVPATREGGGAAPLVVAGLLSVGTLIAFGMACQPSSVPWAFLHPAGALAAMYQSFDGVFRDAFSSPWRIEQMSEPPTAAMLALEPLLAIGFHALAAALLLSAVERVLAGEPKSRLTKRAAVLLFLVVAAAIIVPLRCVMLDERLKDDHLGGIALALALPYLACVLGATPQRLERLPARWSADGAGAHGAALAMVALTMGLVSLFFGPAALAHALEERNALAALGFLGMAATVPVYALWAATRIHTAGGRLAFWAVVLVHYLFLMPSMFIAFEDYYEGSRHVRHLLSQIHIALGALAVSLTAWRQALARRAA